VLMYHHKPRPTTVTASAITRAGLSRDCSPFLLATDHHLPDEESRRSDRASKLEIVSDSLDPPQHFLQRSSDSDLGHGIGQFAVLDPQTGCSARVIARNNIDTESDQFGHVEPALHGPDQLRGVGVSVR